MTVSQLPHDQQAECAVLASLVYDQDAWERIESSGLVATDFFDARLRVCFTTLSQLHRDQQPVSFAVLCRELGEKRIAKLGGELELDRLVRGVEGLGTVAVGYYAGIVRRCSLQRQLLSTAGHIAKLAHAHDGTAQDLQKAALGLWQDLDVAHATPGGLVETMLADQVLITDWPEPLWAIPEYLTSGLAILGGRPKAGKSWLALQIAQSVGSGGVCLGKRVEQGPVLYLALEDPWRRLKSRMLMQGWPRSLPVEFLTLGEFIDHVGDLRDGGAPRLARQIEAKRYRLVVIDTLSRSVSGDQSDVGEMTAALTPLQAMALRYNCIVLLIDHLRKHMGQTYDIVADLLGSTAKAAMPDCLWGLFQRKGKAGAILALTGRDLIPQQLELRFDPMTGCWQNQGELGALKVTERRQAVMDYLETTGEAGVVGIAKAIASEKGNTYRELQNMVAAGLLLRDKQGPKRVLYRLPEQGGYSDTTTTTTTTNTTNTTKQPPRQGVASLWLSGCAGCLVVERVRHVPDMRDPHDRGDDPGCVAASARDIPQWQNRLSRPGQDHVGQPTLPGPGAVGGDPGETVKIRLTVVVPGDP